MQAMLFDCGGVMVSPVTGDWLLAPTFDRILGFDFMDHYFDAFHRVRANHVQLLPDTNLIYTDDEEYALFLQYYAAVFEEMGLSVSRQQIERIAFIQTYHDDRYHLFSDVLTYLSKWHTTHKLGIVSDAPPSTRRILKKMGVMEHIDAATFSCDIGILKPDPRIYQSTLDMLCVKPEEALFIDDYPSKLHGAQAMGIQCVQMVREMPPLFAMPPIWDGDVVHSFEELDIYVKSVITK